MEGRRVVPVLPRGRPVTAYTAVADASRARAERLAGRLPLPADTRSYQPGQAAGQPPPNNITRSCVPYLVKLMAAYSKIGFCFGSLDKSC